MGTTLDRAAVGREALAEALTTLVLESRQTLPRAANGRPMAPSDARAAQIRKDMGQGRALPIHSLLTVLECDVRDQVPFSEIIAPLRQMIAHLEVLCVAGALRPAERPMPSLVRSETKAQGRADLAQLRVMERPECPSSLEDAIRESSQHRSALATFEIACEQQLAKVRTARKPAGAARGNMAVVR